LATVYDRRMADRKLLGIGLIGAAVSALCCFTPILVALLAAVGLSAVTGWLDYVLLPAIAVSLAVVIYALARRKPA
jgi:mercuric ion transport protein